MYIYIVVVVFQRNDKFGISIRDDVLHCILFLCWDESQFIQYSGT